MREDCFCERLERLVGVAVEDYTSRFLIRTGDDPNEGTIYYRCRQCRTDWALETDRSTGQLFLRRLPGEAMV